MAVCTVPVFNIVLERLAPRLFSPNRQDLDAFGRLAHFFVKWSTLAALKMGVLQHAGVHSLSVLLRLAAEVLHS